MLYYLTKTLPLLLLPVSIALAFALLTLVFIFAGKRRLSIFSLIITIGVLWVSSLPIVAARLLWTLERQYLPVPMEKIPASDCIVLLGGALSYPHPPRVDIDLTDSSDRIYQTAKLYRAGKAKTVIIAAGNQPWNQDWEPEAHLLSKLLLEWGVPVEAIVLDASSKNTYENAINSRDLVRDNGCQSTLLVTSSWHMPRAVATFKKAGIKVVPISVDIRLVEGDAVTIAKYIPRADALDASSLAIFEWMGIWVYRIRGWI